MDFDPTARWGESRCGLRLVRTRPPPVNEAKHEGYERTAIVGLMRNVRFTFDVLKSRIIGHKGLVWLKVLRTEKSPAAFVA
jgi:hypothetical protein